MARKYRLARNNECCVVPVVKLPKLFMHIQMNTHSTNKEVDLTFASQQLHCPEAISTKIHSLV